MSLVCPNECLWDSGCPLDFSPSLGSGRHWLAAGPGCTSQHRPLADTGAQASGMVARGNHLTPAYPGPSNTCLFLCWRCWVPQVATVQSDAESRGKESLGSKEGSNESVPGVGASRSPHSSSLEEDFGSGTASRPRARRGESDWEGRGGAKGPPPQENSGATLSPMLKKIQRPWREGKGDRHRKATWVSMTKGYIIA